MARRRQCSRCGTFNAATASECDGCSVQFADLAREQKVAVSKTPDLCAFSDRGERCMLRGIISMGTGGGGQWFCRAHWEVVNERPTPLTGNAIPPRQHSIAEREYHAKMAAYKAKREAVPEPAPERQPGEDREQAA